SRSATAAWSRSTTTAGCPAARPAAPGAAALQADQAAANGLDDGLGPRRGPQLHHHAVDVELGRVVADAEAVGDQLVGQALGEQLDDLALALGQLAAALGLARRL